METYDSGAEINFRAPEAKSAKADSLARFTGLDRCSEAIYRLAKGIGLLALCALHFALCASPAWAIRPYAPVHPDPVLESWRWRSFPELKGLGLASMAEDRDGNMWFGMRDGARRYDGVKWTAFTEADGILGSPVIALRGARDGGVYAGTPMGVSRFQDGKWRRVFPPEGGPMWPVTDLMEASDGSMWAGTAWGALHFGQGGPTLVTSGEMAASMRSLLPDLRVSVVPDAVAPARPWPASGYRSFSIGVNEGGRARAPSVILAVARGGPGEAAGLRAGDRIVAMGGAADKLTVEREGLSKPFEVTVTRAQVAGGTRIFSVYDICEDREGMFWFGLWNGEVVRYDVRQPEGGRPAQLFTGFGRGGDPFHPRILQTDDGTTWAVSRGAFGGINRFDGQEWTSFRLSDEGGTDMNPDIAQTGDGAVWVGGQGGVLHAYRNGAWIVYQRPEAPTPSTYNFLLKTSDGALWIGGVGQEAVRLDLNTSRWTTCRDLRFECETADGSLWFVSRDSGVVRNDPSTRSTGSGQASSGQGGQGWMRYGVEDGLMDNPRGVLATRKGVVWAFGADDSIAATARFDGSRWVVERHPRLSSSIRPKACESSDGSVWFIAGAPWLAEKGQVGGILQFDGERWIHHTPPEAPNWTFDIEQTPDGTLWFGASGLRSYDGREWKRIPEPEGVTSWVHDLAVSGDGHLWGATRDYGVFRYDGGRGDDPVNRPGKGTWTFYDVRDGLADNMIGGLLQTSDGSVWAVTPQGTSRFDPLRLAGARSGQASTSSGQGGRTHSAGSGQAWVTHALPPDLSSQWGLLAMMRQSRDDAIWIQSAFADVWKTVRYQPDADRPETEIVLSAKEVSQPGNTTLAWKGSDPWKATPEGELQFAYRMDGGEWSAFSPATSKIFEAVPGGKHVFEVKARDRDFNEDPTPASVVFTVVPPVWRQPWFIGLMAVLLGAIAFQTTRVVRRDRRLREANTALSAANKDLFGVNRDLQQTLQEKEEAQRQLIQAERMAAVGELVAGSAHELNNPMAVASSMMQSIGEVLKEDTPEELIQDRALMLQNIQVGLKDLNRAKDIVSSLLSLSDRTRSYAEAVQVNIVADDALRMLKGRYDEAKVQVVKDYAENLPPVTGSFADLGQMAMHLVRNAVEAIKGSGTITLRTYGESGPHPGSLSLATPLPHAGEGKAEYVVFECQDTGAGIPPEIRGDIFKPFFKTKPPAEGTGLGLYICREVVEKHGGTIEVDSAVGKGTTFRVKLPLTR